MVVCRSVIELAGENLQTRSNPIREGVLRDSQFPATLTDAEGTFHKPTRW
jgi:hypothetical protein